MSESAIVLGLDGGGTRTRVSISQEGRILASAENGSIKRLRVGTAVAEENLRELLAEVYKQAGVTQLAAACAGVASSKMPGVQEWIQAVFTDFNIACSEIVGDEVIAYRVSGGYTDRLVAPSSAVVRRMLSGITIACACGTPKYPSRSRCVLKPR